MARMIGFAADPKAEGTRLDEMVAGSPPKKFVEPTIFLPATSANVDDQLQTLERKDEVRGRRADVAPQSFASRPQLTFESRAYPKLLRLLLRNALGGTVSHSAPTPPWNSPEPAEDTVGPTQSTLPPLLHAWLVREDQLDRLTGLIVSELEINLPVDGEGTVKATLEGLYHQVASVAAPPKEPDGTTALTKTMAEILATIDYTGYEKAFMLRDVLVKKATFGDTLAEVEKASSFQFTFNNGLITDFQSIFRPGHNIDKGKFGTTAPFTNKLWFPNWHKLGAQNLTGKLDLSGIDAVTDAKRLFTVVEKLQIDAVTGALGTTPDAEEALKLVFYKSALTGGGPDPLVREGDQRASYEFTGYLDESANKDVEATFVGATQVT